MLCFLFYPAEKTSAPLTESEFQAGTKPQSIDDARRETDEEETLRYARI